VSLFTPSLHEQKHKNLAAAVIASGVGVALLYYGRAFLVTLLTAIVIALLLEPFVSFLVRFRLPRAVASFLVCTVALLLLYLVGVGLYTQGAALFEDLPSYSQRISDMVDTVALRVDAAEKTAIQILVPRRFREQEAAGPKQPAPETTKRRRRSAEPPKPTAPAEPTEVRIRAEPISLVEYLYDNLQLFYNAILLVSFVPFLVYFMLSWRDHIRRSFLSLFHGDDRHAAGRSWQGIAGMARAYVLGNFILGLLLSVASSVFFWAVSLPYYLLIGPLSGFLSLVPYIGLPLAMLPPFFVAVPVYNRLPAYLIIGAVVGFLHLLALNLLYPKLVGGRVHLNPLAVTVALMFWGTLWGAIGLVLAIPITAGMKAVFDNVADLQPYGRLLGD